MSNRNGRVDYYELFLVFPEIPLITPAISSKTPANGVVSRQTSESMRPAPGAAGGSWMRCAQSGAVIQYGDADQRQDN